MLMNLKLDADMLDVAPEIEEELKNFQPSLEVEEAVDAIYNRDLTDVADIITEMIREARQNNPY